MKTQSKLISPPTCTNDLIATLTLNPALDNTLVVRHLVVDDANRWTSRRRDPGGKGIGVSRVIHRLGGKTIAYGFIGGHDGKAVEILLNREKVKHDFTHIVNETRTNIIVTDTETKQQTRLDAPGPTVSPRELEALKRKTSRIKPRPHFLVMCGSVPPGVPDDIYAQLIDRAKSAGVKTVLDSDGPWFRKGIESKPFFIKPNVHEASRLLDRDLVTEEDIIDAVLELCNKGIEVVAISRGKEGLIASDGKSIMEAIPPPLTVRSSVGSGDATVAGMVLSLCQGSSLAEACRLGSAAGAAVVLTPGTLLCRLKDVERLLPQITIGEITR
ncbi:1-phosphofructokinase [Chloroflexota bacterium]